MSDDETFSVQAQQLGCAALVDAMGRLHRHRAHLLPMRSPDPSRPLFGPAITIGYLPYRDTDGAERQFGDLLDEALISSPPSPVLVLSSGGYPEESHGGGVKLSMARRHVGGVLADARLRDFGELREYGLPTWCRGETPRWGGDVVMPSTANVAIEVAGVRIVPGDYVFMDASGGVVIPAMSLMAVFDIALAVRREDTASLALIRGDIS